jgi:hypothetical protein
MRSLTFRVFGCLSLYITMIAALLFPDTIAIAASPALQDLTVTDLVTGGNRVTLTVTLREAAPTGGVSVAIASSNPAVVVPDAIVVKSGERSASRTANTRTVAERTKAVVTATLGTTTSTETIVVMPVHIASLETTPSLPGGTDGTGTVTLTGPAAQLGATIHLTSNRPSVLQVPDSILIPAGATSGGFTFTTSIHTSDAAVLITAKLSGSPRGTDTTLVVGTGSEPTATASATIPVTATSTVFSTATATVEPTATNTVEPTATSTVESTATNTPEPTATSTVESTATSTAEPTATATIVIEPTIDPCLINPFQCADPCVINPVSCVDPCVMNPTLCMDPCVINPMSCMDPCDMFPELCNPCLNNPTMCPADTGSNRWASIPVHNEPRQMAVKAQTQGITAHLNRLF